MQLSDYFLEKVWAANDSLSWFDIEPSRSSNSSYFFQISYKVIWKQTHYRPL